MDGHMEPYNNSIPDWTQKSFKSGQKLSRQQDPLPLLVPQRPITKYGKEIHSGISKTPGKSPTANSKSSIQALSPGSSKLDNEYDEASIMRGQKTRIWLEWIMVLAVLGAACFMAIRNNTPDIIFNLCTLCFGYYFRGMQEVTPRITK